MSRLEAHVGHTVFVFWVFLTEKIDLSLAQQNFLSNQTLFISTESKQLQIFLLQKWKFHQNSKSPDDIDTTMNMKLDILLFVIISKSSGVSVVLF